MNKRIMSLILAFLMLSSVLFTGCGVFGEGTTTEEEPEISLDNLAITLSMFVVSEKPVSEQTAKDVEAAFNKILETAVFYKIPKNQMPKTLVVISDMEINRYMCPGRHWDFLKVMEARFNAKGYALPKIVMWNVNARKDTVLSQDERTIFISGQSASSFKTLCQNLDGVTAYELMLQVLNGPAYAKVTI